MNGFGLTNALEPTASSFGSAALRLRFRRRLTASVSHHKRKSIMAQFRFGAASPEEMIVYGAQRPGYPSRNVDGAHVGDWISFMQQRGIRRVCCLLPTKQLAYYRVDLLDKYCEAFGE